MTKKTKKFIASVRVKVRVKTDLSPNTFEVRHTTLEREYLFTPEPGSLKCWIRELNASGTEVLCAPDVYEISE